MTTQETKTDKEIDTPRGQGAKDVLDAYRVHLDLWKVQNDNYFKRVQVMMIAVQGALFAAALKVVDPKAISWIQLLILAVVGVLGVLSAGHWMALNKKQTQYMEFCRRTLRNLEHRLAELGLPLRYFTTEAHVFGPLRTEIPELAGTALRTEGERHVVEFVWGGERYPDPDDLAKGGIHRLAEVSGGMISFDNSLASGIRVVWVLALIGVLVAAIRQVM